ncbi:hypothetical protein DLAC_01410 [Tieghemostelium lacteum]|uniref:Uncharacterized protein n=1 Tax=Tieghemostelium lacteum TaxID=361077 RepID=A0A152A6T4_TIELA|nr:hypothetical protein DLAC_01410 [Tieghemostelium lacteum]|eukprot:KYR01906.1 hypothetical protein DLAC_01410 [Tieghemostelium lacteum]
MIQIKSITLLLVVCIAFVGICFGQLPDNDPQLCQQKIQREDCPIIPYPFTSVDDNDQIEVWYLQAPIFEGMFGNFFGKLKGFHSAVGFYDLTTGLNYTAEYDAYYEVANGTVPNIVNINGTKEILWCNAGILCSIPFINETYWDPAIFSTASKTYMTTINGAQLNKFSEWMQEYNISNPNYQTWDIWNKFGESLWMSSNTCDDFAANAFQYLFEIGATYDCSIVFKRDYLNIYSQQPTLVDYESNKDSIIKFYEAFDIRKGESYFQIIEDIISIIGLEKYIYYQDNYYLLQLNYPFLDLKYDFAPVPGCSIEKKSFNEKNYKVIDVTTKSK